jgi:FkbM family methyltransferase
VGDVGDIHVKTSARNMLSILFGKIGNVSTTLSENILHRKSRLIKKGDERNLYQTSSKKLFWLNNTGHIDQEIIRRGIFEPKSTEIAQTLVKEGDVVLDIGANIGYYTVLFSKLVGKNGKVFAFEPTTHFLDILQRNLDANGVSNVEIVKCGLSNKKHTMEIGIGPSSATLHPAPGFDRVDKREIIDLTTLDIFTGNRNLPKIDFIKIDVDGHEPFFFQGAWDSLDKYEPVVLLELSHLHYLKAGFTAWDFYDLLKERGYFIFHEDNLEEMTRKEDFLRRCANFAYSTNIVICKRKLYADRG